MGSKCDPEEEPLRLDLLQEMCEFDPTFPKTRGEVSDRLGDDQISRWLSCGYKDERASDPYPMTETWYCLLLYDFDGGDVNLDGAGSLFALHGAEMCGKAQRHMAARNHPARSSRLESPLSNVLVAADHHQPDPPSD